MAQIKIGILFNCAGIIEHNFFRFCSNSHGQLKSLVDVNATVPGLLYHAVLPQMVKRRNGLMLCMASASNMSPQPFIPFYGATKSFLFHLSRSLQVNHIINPYIFQFYFRPNFHLNILEFIFTHFILNLFRRQ